jgi:hypothetical protein
VIEFRERAGLGYQLTISGKQISSSVPKVTSTRLVARPFAELLRRLLTWSDLSSEHFTRKPRFSTEAAPDDVELIAYGDERNSGNISLTTSSRICKREPR